MAGRWMFDASKLSMPGQTHARDPAIRGRTVLSHGVGVTWNVGDN
ncbi:MAG: hypothetical protein AAF218_00630 [Pseudomonadota bacterium]